MGNTQFDLPLYGQSFLANLGHAHSGVKTLVWHFWENSAHLVGPADPTMNRDRRFPMPAEVPTIVPDGDEPSEGAEPSPVVPENEIKLLEEDIGLNSAQVAKLRQIRQSAVRRLILFGLMICAAGWVLFQTYSFSELYLRVQLESNPAQTVFQHIEALSSLLGFLAVLSVCSGLLVLEFVTAGSHFFSARRLIGDQETAIANASEALQDALRASRYG